MEPLLFCRICLSTEVKLYDMTTFELKSTYETLCGSNMSQCNNLVYACVYCAAVLRKFSSFKARCEQANQLLEYLSNEDVQLTSACSNLNTFKETVAHPFKLQVIHNFDSTIADIKEENIKTDRDTEFDNKDFFNFNSIDSDDEPLVSKITRKKKEDYTNHEFKSEIDIVDVVCENHEDISNHGDTHRDKIDSNIEDKTKVEILDLEFDLVLLSKEQQIEEVMARRTSSNYINSRYKCDYCFKGYMTEVTYKNHMILHDKSSGPHACAVCHTRWESARALAAHAATHARQYVCRACQHRDKSHQRAKEHARWHRGHQYTCKVCGLQFARSTTLLTHVRVRHPRGAACDACGARFLGAHGLSMHKKKAHRSLDSKLEYKECSHCGAKFKSEGALTRHREQATSDTCDTKLSWCEHCGEGLPTEDLHREHLEMHLVTATPSCTECGGTFSSERALAAHAARAHCGAPARARVCVCELCGHATTSRSLLLVHQRTHTGEKPYECTLCNKRFGVQQRLQIHMRTHTGERPFQCDVCPKAFKHKAALNRHDRVHTGIRPYRCGTCGKCFSQSNSMKQHAAAVHMKAPLYARKSKPVEFMS